MASDKQNSNSINELEQKVQNMFVEKKLKLETEYKLNLEKSISVARRE